MSSTLTLLLLLPLLGAQAGTEVAPAVSPGAAAAPVVGDEPVRVLVLDIQPGSLPSDTARAAGDLVTVALGEVDDVEVASGADIQRAMQLEGEKAALGCDDESCLAELAGALGADLVVFGRGAQLGSAKILYLSLFDSTAGRTVGRVTIEFDDASELLAKIPPAVADLAFDELRRRGASPRDPSPSTPTPKPGAVDERDTTEEASGDGDEGSSTWPGWVMVGFGAPALGVGALTLAGTFISGWTLWVFAEAIAMQSEERYREATTAAERQAELENIKTTQANWPTVAIVWHVLGIGPLLLTMAGIALVSGGTYWLLSDDDVDDVEGGEE